MTTQEYKERIAKIVLDNLHNAEDAGCGMYNISLDIDKQLQVASTSEDEYVLQVYPLRGNQFYLCTYLLVYHKDGEHTDELFESLTQADQRAVYDAVIAWAGKGKPKQIGYLKEGMTFEDKIALLNLWRKDTGAEEQEAYYDLDDDEDAKGWINLYGAEHLYDCRIIARYWVGGLAFYAFDAGHGDDQHITGLTTKAVTEGNVDQYIAGAIDDIEGRYTNPETDIECVSMYHEYIDTDRFMKDYRKIDVCMLEERVFSHFKLVKLNEIVTIDIACDEGVGLVDIKGLALLAEDDHSQLVAFTENENGYVWYDVDDYWRDNEEALRKLYYAF